MVNPDGYEKNKTISKAILDTHLPTILNLLDWKPNDIVLDYGCGAGLVALNQILPLAQQHKASKIFGVDMSVEMIEYAREAADKLCQNGKNFPIEFSVGNIMEENWILKSLKFDRILCLNVIHFIEDYRGFLKRVYNQLNSGGQFALIIPLTGTSAIFEKLLEYPVNENTEEKFTSDYKSSWTRDPEKAGKLLRDAIRESQFVLQHFELTNVSYSYPEVRDYIQNMRSFVNTADLSTEENERLDNFLIENVCTLYNQPANTKPYVVTMKTCRIILQRN